MMFFLGPLEVYKGLGPVRFFHFSYMKFYQRGGYDDHEARRMEMRGGFCPRGDM